MSTPPQEGWQPQQPLGSMPADQGQPYGQPFDPSPSDPRQQPPPPGWEHGTWTQHPAPPPTKGIGPTWLLVAVAVLVVVAVGVVVMAV